MPVDFKQLGEALAARQLAGKPIDRYTKEEVEFLAIECAKALRPKRERVEFPKPHITKDGELRIPWDSDPRYHWWRPCGQSIAVTLRELGASEDVWEKYVNTKDEPF